MNKVISFGKYRNKSISELINDKHYYQWLMKQDNLKIKYKKDFESIEDSFLSNELEELNFMDLPSDIRVYIFNINKEAEKREFGSHIYNHIKGRIRIYKSIRVKDFYWLNCVSCGTKLSNEKLTLEDMEHDKIKKDLTESAFLSLQNCKRNHRHYHWCYKCFCNYSPYYYKNGQKIMKKEAVKDAPPPLRSRPLQLGKDRCPLIINNHVVLKPLGLEYKYIIANLNGDYFDKGELLLE